MKINKNDEEKKLRAVGADFFERLWERSWTYIRTVVDVVREPILILDKDLRIMAANEPFYETFKVSTKDTDGKLIYDLGNGQWNIPALQKLLGDILSKNTFFKGFQVAHEFPGIGRKVMILNARQIHVKSDDSSPETIRSFIVLAMEDVTDIMVVADSLAEHARQIEAKLTSRTQKMELHIEKLEKQLSEFKKK